jgi:GNAT superfamily N-acetyltransferase
VGAVDGELVAHVAVATKNVGRGGIEARACRLVVMPEWQGAGVGMRFLNAVCQLQLDGQGRIPGRRMTTIFHTSHPGLCAALRRDQKWVQVSASLYGGNKASSARTLARSQKRTGATFSASGFGGHFRAVQGFRYLGPERAAQRGARA